MATITENGESTKLENAIKVVVESKLFKAYSCLSYSKTCREVWFLLETIGIERLYY